MKTLPSSAGKVWGCRLLGLSLMVPQLYVLKSLVSTAPGEPVDLTTAIRQALIAIASGVILFAGRRIFPEESSERSSFQWLGFGFGALGFAEISQVNLALLPLQVLARITACLSFCGALQISTRRRGNEVQVASPQIALSSETLTDAQSWLVGFVLGFLVGIGPVLNVAVISDSIFRHGKSLHIVWYIGLLFAAGLISVLKPKRVWRWGIAVGLGHPIAVVTKMCLSSDGVSNEDLSIISIFFLLLIAALGSFAGAYCGFLIRKSFDIIRKEGWRGWL